MKAEKLFVTLNKIAPEETAQDWDNGGIQIQTSDRDILKILLCLEITHAVIDEAIELGVDWIITHHPLLFHALQTINHTTLTGGYAVKLIKHDISVYSTHTSFDAAEGGNNHYLANLLALEQIDVIGKDGLIRYGIFKKPMTLRQVTEQLANELNLPIQEMKIVGNPDTMIHQVGICTGAGGDLIAQAEQFGCDLFITGEVRHHEAQAARETGMNVIDAGHYGTERIFPAALYRHLWRELGNEIELYESKINLNPFQIML